MTATPAALDSAVEPKSLGTPSRRNSPESRRWTPATILTRVDFPAPFSPTSAWIDPGSTRMPPELSATTGPNVFETSRSSSVAGTSLGEVMRSSAD